MTIIGTMPKLSFLMYVIKMISLQMEIATHGRIELFVIMRPWDYLVKRYTSVKIIVKLFRICF